MIIFLGKSILMNQRQFNNYLSAASVNINWPGGNTKCIIAHYQGSRVGSK